MSCSSLANLKKKKNSLQITTKITFQTYSCVGMVFTILFISLFVCFSFLPPLRVIQHSFDSLLRFLFFHTRFSFVKEQEAIEYVY